MHPEYTAALMPIGGTTSRMPGPVGKLGLPVDDGCHRVRPRLAIDKALTTTSFFFLFGAPRKCIVAGMAFAGRCLG